MSLSHSTSDALAPSNARRRSDSDPASALRHRKLRRIREWCIEKLLLGAALSSIL
jgi:hypothetical protein